MKEKSIIKNKKEIAVQLVSAMALYIVSIIPVLSMLHDMRFTIGTMLIQLFSVATSLYLMTLLTEDVLVRIVGVTSIISAQVAIFTCYEIRSLKASFASMLVIAVIALFLKIQKQEKVSIPYRILAVIFLIGLAYLSIPKFALTFVTVLIICMVNKPKYCIYGLVALIASIPSFIMFISKGGYGYASFSEVKYYQLSELLSTFRYKESLPGIGLQGLIIFLVSVWIYLTEIEVKPDKTNIALMILTAVFVILSLDIPMKNAIVKKLFIRNYPIIEGYTFVEFISILIPVISVKAIEYIRKNKNEYISIAVPIFISLAGILVMVYCGDTVVGRFIGY
jgi:hypothetical protein